MEEIKITIPLRPITKKNHQRIVRNKSGTPFVIPSPQYSEYEHNAMLFLGRWKGLGIDYPVTVKCLFYRKTQSRGDLTNYLEAIDDVLVKAGVLADDTWSIITSHDGSRVLYDKENPRTEVYIAKYDKT